MTLRQKPKKNIYVHVLHTNLVRKSCTYIILVSCIACLLNKQDAFRGLNFLRLVLDVMLTIIA